MLTLKQQTRKALEELVAFIANSPWKDKYYLQIKELMSRLDEPCVLAVVGRVKAGKSSFINALLGADLALTGTLETTATINYFRFGHPEDPQRPVRVVWTNDQETWETVDFLNSLQGNSMENIRKSSNIRRLEFFVDNPKLEHVRLVDTPGTGAVVGDDGDAHEDVTREFLDFQKQLRERHSKESLKITRDADAVIYITGAAVGQRSDADFLQDFQGAETAIYSFNTIGVMSKIDLSDELLENKDLYAQDMADQYNKVLSAPIRVFPASAGIQRFLDSHSEDEIRDLQSKLRTGFAPGRLGLAFKSDKIFKSGALPGCTLSVDERSKLCEKTPWRVFVVIAKMLSEYDLEDARAKLRDIAGIDAISQALESHFFQRGHLLRCHTVLKGVYEFVQTLLRTDLFKLHQDFLAQQKDAQAYAVYVRSHPEFSSSTCGKQLLCFIEAHSPIDNCDILRASLEKIEETFEHLLFEELDVANKNFEGLKILEEAPQILSPEEKTELQQLFGMFPEDASFDRDYCVKKQLYWRRVILTGRSAQRKKLAEIAEIQYGRKLTALCREKVQADPPDSP